MYGRTNRLSVQQRKLIWLKNFFIFTSIMHLSIFGRPLWAKESIHMLISEICWEIKKLGHSDRHTYFGKLLYSWVGFKLVINRLHNWHLSEHSIDNVGGRIISIRAKKKFGKAEIGALNFCFTKSDICNPNQIWWTKTKIQ